MLRRITLHRVDFVSFVYLLLATFLLYFSFFYVSLFLFTGLFQSINQPIRSQNGNGIFNKEQKQNWINFTVSRYFHAKFFPVCNKQSHVFYCLNQKKKRIRLGSSAASTIGWVCFHLFFDTHTHAVWFNANNLQFFTRKMSIWQVYCTRTLC